MPTRTFHKELNSTPLYLILPLGLLCRSFQPTNPETGLKTVEAGLEPTFPNHESDDLPLIYPTQSSVEMGLNQLLCSYEPHALPYKLSTAGAASERKN